jgi:hypothetical protein
LVLAFTFDVSASMGSHDEPYYSRAMKWDPVVAATKAFFADTTSVGVSAALTFFPNDQATLTGTGFGGGGMGMGMGGGGIQRGGASCDAANYETPDVPLTPLPSDAFATAIDSVTPADDDTWRLGTPTGPALEGTLAMIQALRETDANSKYVIVLVTDGAPALCSEEQDDIENVAAVAATALADGIQTYVIGVANPVTEEEPTPPDDTGNLLAIAQAGGTEQAFIVDTNDPAQTVTDFKSVIEGIRENGFSCEVLIPQPPEGETFDKEKVNVNFTNAQGETPFVYDPTCTERYAWRYDDEAAPTVIELCETVCGDIKAQSDGELSVQFGCKQRIGVER